MTRDVKVVPMQIVYSDRHRVHRGEFEFFRGELVPCFEKPARADFVLAALVERGIGPVLEPRSFGIAALERVHTPRYLRFLERAWREWSALGQTTPTMRCPRSGRSAAFATTSSRRTSSPTLGLYSFDSGTPLTAGTWAPPASVPTSR